MNNTSILHCAALSATNLIFPVSHKDLMLMDASLRGTVKLVSTNSVHFCSSFATGRTQGSRRSNE
eukprot:4771158-Amphidinium_carterae.2